MKDHIISTALTWCKHPGWWRLAASGYHCRKSQVLSLACWRDWRWFWFLCLSGRAHCWLDQRLPTRSRARCSCCSLHIILIKIWWRNIKLELTVKKSVAATFKTINCWPLGAQLCSEQKCPAVLLRVDWGGQGEHSPGSRDEVGGVALGGNALNPVLHRHQETSVVRPRQEEDSAEWEVSQESHLTRSDLSAQLVAREKREVWLWSGSHVQTATVRLLPTQLPRTVVPESDVRNATVHFQRESQPRSDFSASNYRNQKSHASLDFPIQQYRFKMISILHQSQLTFPSPHIAPDHLVSQRAEPVRQTARPTYTADHVQLHVLLSRYTGQYGGQLTQSRGRAIFVNTFKLWLC